MQFINMKSIRAYCNKRGRRAGKTFLKRLNQDVVYHLEGAVDTKDGGKVTIDDGIADWGGLKLPKHMPLEPKRTRKKGRPIPCSETEFVKKKDKKE